MISSYMYSFLYYTVGSLALTCGMSVIQSNTKAYINRTFMAFTIALQIWLYGLAVSSSAYSMETGLIFRQISAIGSGLINSIILNFVIILTCKEKILKKWWAYVLIYLPAVVSIAVFCVLPFTGLSPYRLIQTENGWVNDHQDNVWYLFNYLYFTLFLIIDLALIWSWKRKPSDKQVKEKSINILKAGALFKENIVSMLFFLIIPIISYRFIKEADATVWALIFAFIIISLLFNRPSVVISVAVSAIFTQIFTWSVLPEVVVKVNGTDYILRVTLLIITTISGLYVNKAYLSKIKENTDQIKIQKFVSDISYDFVNVSEQNLNEKVNGLLEQCGKFLSADCAYIAWFDQDHSTIDHTFQWHKNEEESDKKGILPLDPLHCLIDKFGLDRLILIPNVQKLPPEAEEIKNKLICHNIRTLILIPIKTQKTKIGFLGFSASEPVEKLNLQATSAIETIANIVSSALEKVKNEKEIKYMAYFDQLTRLPNRLLFTDRANQEISVAKRTVKMVAIVFIDLDSFKSINDSFGHELGDELLIEVANIISKCVRHSDTVSRFTGDKFVVLLNNISSSEDVAKIARKIIEMFNKPISLKDQEIFTTASIGISIYPKDGEDVETLIKNADTAMYKAKNRGKNQYMLCSEDMRDEVLEEMRLTNLLYRAQERNQLVLFYQPQILLETNQIVGFEALVRWNLPGSGLISPLKFIPIAERTGLINSIGEWVIRTACLQSKAWQDAGFPKLRMAVNISVHQLRNPYLVSQIDGILKETGLSPQFLELEITESVAARQNDNFIILLNKLKELGVTISIDDFGTEYSSLSRLKTLPIDRIKMDMQFVHGIEESDKDKAITDVIINLAKSLGLKVLAEGVETMPQLHFLNRKMCDEVQGFYFYRPMPAKEIEKILGDSL